MDVTRPILSSRSFNQVYSFSKANQSFILFIKPIAYFYLSPLILLIPFLLNLKCDTQIVLSPVSIYGLCSSIDRQCMVHGWNLLPFLWLCQFKELCFLGNWIITRRSAATFSVLRGYSLVCKKFENHNGTSLVWRWRGKNRENYFLVIRKFYAVVSFRRGANPNTENTDFSNRQFMGSSFSRPQSVWLFPLGFAKRQCLCWQPDNIAASEDRNYKIYQSKPCRHVQETYCKLCSRVEWTFWTHLMNVKKLLQTEEKLDMNIRRD